MIVNPLKPAVKKILVVDGNPESSMRVETIIEWQGWRDKAVIALVLALGAATKLLYGYTWENFIINIGEFFFSFFREALYFFFVNFIGLTGLTEIAKRRNNKG